MLEELRKKSQHSMCIKLILCVITIAVCMVITKASFITYLQGPMKLNTDEEWDVDELKGKYVTLEVSLVYGGFAEETSTNTKTNVETVTSTCYVCSKTDEYGYPDELFGIKIKNKDQNDVEAVLNDMTYTKTYQVTGTFTKMSGEMLQFYDEAIEYNLGAEGLDYALPYCIYDGTIGGLDYVWVAILTAIAFGALVLAVIVIINFLRGNHDRYMKRYLKKNTSESMSGIEADYASANVIDKNYRIGKKYFFYAKGGTMALLPLAEQVWAYYYQRTGKNSVSQIRFYDLQHKLIAVNISKNLSSSVLHALDSSFNHMVVGYDANLEKMYNKNFQEFLNIKYNPSRSAAATQDAFFR